MTSKQVNISFIITNYNLPIVFLRECIESLIALDINPDEREIILVDDGSDESPEPYLSDFLNDIKIIRQENKGLSVARNVGIRESSGRYIQFVDGDDCLLQYYNKCIRTIETQDVDLLFFKFVNEKNASFSGKNNYYGTGIEYMTHHNLCASAWGYIFKRNLLGDDLRFTPGIYHEDEEFTPLLTIRAKNVAQYSGSAYYYRTRENSIIHTTDKEHLHRRINDFIGVVQRLKDKESILSGKEGKALERRIDQLTMDIMYDVILLSRDKSKVDDILRLLKSKDIEPIPIKLYTLKYFLFSLFAKTKIGRTILFKIIIKRQ